jgi:hypothetical protein
MISVPYCATMYLLTHAVPFLSMLRPSERQSPLWTTLRPIELGCTLLSCAATFELLRCILTISLDPVFECEICRCRNLSGTEIMRPSPVQECSGTALRLWMRVYRWPVLIICCVNFYILTFHSFIFLISLLSLRNPLRKPLYCALCCS